MYIVDISALGIMIFRMVICLAVKNYILNYNNIHIIRWINCNHIVVVVHKPLIVEQDIPLLSSLTLINGVDHKKLRLIFFF